MGHPAPAAHQQPRHGSSAAHRSPYVRIHTPRRGQQLDTSPAASPVAPVWLAVPLRHGLRQLFPWASASGTLRSACPPDHQPETQPGPSSSAHRACMRAPTLAYAARGSRGPQP